MPITPLNIWIKTYEPGMKDYYKKTETNPAYPIKEFWSKWVNDGGKAIQTGLPFVGGKGKTDPSKFSPVVFPNPGTPISSAMILANAWKSWYTSIKWTPGPPVPPFSVIEKVEASPIGVPIAYSTLFAGLIAEFALIPPDVNTAFLLKATAFGTLFYTATMSAGIQLSGKSLSTPPVPLTIPMSSVL